MYFGETRWRRRLTRTVLTFAIATATAIAATAAVHIDASTGLPGGLLGMVLTALEFVFIAAIIPLILTSAHSGAVVVGMLLERSRSLRALPRVRMRRF